MVSGFNARLIERIEMRLAITDGWYLVLPGDEFTDGQGAWSAEILCSILMWSDGGC